MRNTNLEKLLVDDNVPEEGLSVLGQNRNNWNVETNLEDKMAEEVMEEVLNSQ